eukprot:SAG31_NODE_2753_length_5141_cov_3.640619_10_plen_79_part_00
MDTVPDCVRRSTAVLNLLCVPVYILDLNLVDASAVRVTVIGNHLNFNLLVFQNRSGQAVIKFKYSLICGIRHSVPVDL